MRIESADPAVLDSAPSFLQTSWWASFKSLHGWTAMAFQVWDEAGRLRPLSILLRRLPLGLTLAYVPHPTFTANELDSLAQELRSKLPRGTVCLRWDVLDGTRVRSEKEGSEEDETPDPMPDPLPRPLRKPAADVQPPDTIILPLLGTEEDLLARMHKKTRYNIRLAEKKGVVVERAGVEALSQWYRLYRETAERDRISIHSERYYRDLFDRAPSIVLWLARFEGQILAGNIVITHGATTTYLYGASSNEHRNLMAPYALQWATITDALRRGCTEYDLFGIPPTNDEKHPMHGLYRFKTGFGGDRVHRSGAWDSVLRPVAWWLWTRTDAVRIWYFKVWKKRA